MERIAISCLSCLRRWKSPAVLSDYERQAQESQPCPRCGAYTLCCVAAEAKRGRATSAARH